MSVPDGRRGRLALLGVVLAGGALLAGEPQPAGRLDVNAIAAQIDAEQDHVSAPQLARWIRDGLPGLVVLDLRPDSEFKALHIPGAEPATLSELARRDLPRDATIVLYSEGGTHAAQAWVLLRARGYRTVYTLREGLYEWVSRILRPRLATDATPAEKKAFDAVEPLSRYFGGLPRRGVPRSEVPEGYWTEAGTVDRTDAPLTASHRHAIRRRGC
ncbi:MAG: rhodanese-like domain-containing protein [Gemmatimonadota bacterium]|jgi:rhodanese-related sulfurtransferase